MKPIFNSLGSNYSLKFALAALTSSVFSSVHELTKLESSLNQLFSESKQNSTFLFYKGRDAIEFALRTAKISHIDQVMTQGFACHAIEQGIVRAGANPLYVDIDRNSTNLRVETLQKTFNEATNQNQIKAVLIQHSLGIPADIEEIANWCKKHKLILIEDLAQSFGAQTPTEKPLGKFGDIIICSFGRDKIIDSVSGGACVVRNKSLVENAVKKYLEVAKEVGFGQIIKDMIYPLLTYLIRSSYQLGIGSMTIGRLLFRIAGVTGLISSPTHSPTNRLMALPHQHAYLANLSLSDLEIQLTHRRQIAQIYHTQLKNLKKYQTLTSANQLENATMLRFPILTENPDKVLSRLAKKGIYLTDRWYRSPVDSGKLNLNTMYEAGSAPNAEKLAQTVINLPTHRYITKDSAHRIVEELKSL